MKKIFKYWLPDSGTFTLRLPINAEILSVAYQNDSLQLWALVDLDEDKCDKTLEIFQTGQSVGYDMGTERKFIGSCLSADHKYVVHVFERIN